MKPITDINIARNLPEKEKVRYSKTVKTDGTVVHVPYFPDIVSLEKDEKAIIWFVDKDGRLMEINYDGDGAYKTEVGK